MFLVHETILEDEIGTSAFRCDLQKCRGACCTLEGGRGAPIEEDEKNEIEAAFPIVRKLLPTDHLKAIEHRGLYEGPPGNRTTVCVDDRACVFAFFEQGIARCSFERAFENGDLSWRKPLSCHLFPLRVRRFGREYMRYEQLAECRSGRELGKSTGTRLFEFLQDPLVRKYGESWYQQLRESIVPREDSRSA